MKPKIKKIEPEIKPEKKSKIFSIRSILIFIRKLLNGSMLTEDFVVNQSKLLFLIFCLILLFISNRYFCSKKLTEMDKLKKELVDLDYEQRYLTARLTSISRQSQIEELLQKKNSDLKKGNSTIYQISK